MTFTELVYSQAARVYFCAIIETLILLLEIVTTIYTGQVLLM